MVLSAQPAEGKGEVTVRPRGLLGSAPHLSCQPACKPKGSEASAGGSKLCPHGGKQTYSGQNSSLTASEVLRQGITVSDVISALVRAGDTPDGHCVSTHPQKAHPTERPHAAPHPCDAIGDPARAEDRYSAHPLANPGAPRLSHLSTVPKPTARDRRGYTASSPSDCASPSPPQP